LEDLLGRGHRVSLAVSPPHRVYDPVRLCFDVAVVTARQMEAQMVHRVVEYGFRQTHRSVVACRQIMASPVPMVPSAAGLSATEAA
jgi:hypothetical protein